MTARGEMIMEQPSADTLKVILSGHWKLGGELPGADKVQQTLEGRPEVRNIVFDTREIAHWDTGLLTFLMNVGTFCSGQKILLNSDGLPQGAKKLLELALAVPEKKDVLADNIGFLVPTERIYLHPWRMSVPIDYQVVVDIVRCDGRLGDAAWLEARWSIFGGPEKKLLKTNRSSIQEPVGGADYAAMVVAQSRALAKLSHDIAEAIQGAGKN